MQNTKQPGKGGIKHRQSLPNYTSNYTAKNWTKFY